MKFVLASYGSRGDVEPCVAVGRELLRRGHDVRMAVPPNLVGFAEAAGLAAVAYGPDSQAILDAHRNFWTCFFRNLWKIQDLIRLRREVGEPVIQCWGEMSTTLTSLADGADLLVTGLNFEQAAANVAEYYDIPLATLHYFPMRANGQLVPILPAPLGRSAMTVYEWLAWRGRRSSRTRSAVNWAYRRPQAPRRDGSPNADRWKSRPTTRFAFPGWQPNGRNGMVDGPLSAR